MAQFTSALQDLISERKLPADALILDLFGASSKLSITPDVMERAQVRLALSNPPGKKGSLGDALHWECLLSTQHGYFFDIVSRDGDFSSELDSKRMKDFLVEEWKRRHGNYAEIQLFRSLSEFFANRFPQIKLSDEAKKDELTSQLSASPNFSTTHALIADLSGFSFFTNTQVIKLFEALHHNTRVGWIGGDSDLQDFYLEIKG